MYKTLNLVGVDSNKKQHLIAFRHRDVKGNILLQHIGKGFGKGMEIVTKYSDIVVYHNDKTIYGGVLTQYGLSNVHPRFTYSRETLELEIIVKDLSVSCIVTDATAFPFIDLIARM